MDMPYLCPLTELSFISICLLPSWAPGLQTSYRRPSTEEECTPQSEIAANVAASSMRSGRMAFPVSLLTGVREGSSKKLLVGDIFLLHPKIGSVRTEKSGGGKQRLPLSN